MAPKGRCRRVHPIGRRGSCRRHHPQQRMYVQEQQTAVAIIVAFTKEKSKTVGQRGGEQGTNPRRELVDQHLQYRTTHRTNINIPPYFATQTRLFIA